MRESHALGETWDEVGRLFRVAVTTANQDAAKLELTDLGFELACDLIELMRAGSEATSSVLRGPGRGGMGSRSMAQQ